MLEFSRCLDTLPAGDSKRFMEQVKGSYLDFCDALFTTLKLAHVIQARYNHYSYSKAKSQPDPLAYAMA